MQSIRNVAIIAHVDHGKTTLVDEMLKAGKLFSEHQRPGELIMDSNDLEKERGITILSKNASMVWNDHKINIIDTPGHSDFGGEVERVLNMADGVLLLVDAFEGPMPQTRFVLQKALALGLKPIVVINKVDKPNCRPEEVQEMVFDLMFSLNATEDQLDFPTVYGSARDGWMSTDWKKQTEDISAVMDAIIEYIPVPEERKGTPQMLITSLEYSPYVGRIAIGRMHRGTLKTGQEVAVVSRDGKVSKTRIKELNIFDGLGRAKTDVLVNGELGAIIGLEQFDIGDSICDPENPEPLDPIAIDEPTMSMLFTINNSPFFGKDGKFVTSRHIKDRLDKELERNLALRVEETNSADAWNVYGRGVLHLSVLIETMRREGYELQVGQPRVIIKEIGGEKHEPVEELTIDLPDEYSGRAIEMVTQRKGELLSMERKGERVVLEFNIPSRGIIGLRNNMLTATAGEAIMAHRFVEFQPWKGEITKRQNGSLIAMESGKAIAYALDKLQDRGKFFVHPMEEVYLGQVIGENSRDGDMTVNVTKEKKLTNMRTSGSDEKAKLVPPIIFSLEEALEYIQGDEYCP
jgi:GTP-binding protein